MALFHGHEILGRFDFGSVDSQPGLEDEDWTLAVVPEGEGGGGLILDPPL